MKKVVVAMLMVTFSFSMIDGIALKDIINGPEQNLMTLETCQKCREEKRKQAEENRDKKRRMLDEQKRGGDNSI